MTIILWHDSERNIIIVKSFLKIWLKGHRDCHFVYKHWTEESGSAFFWPYTWWIGLERQREEKECNDRKGKEEKKTAEKGKERKE